MLHTHPMKLEFLYYSFAVSVVIVVAGRYFADALFPWFDKFLLNKSREDAKLDALIRARLQQWGHRSISSQNPSSLTESTPEEEEISPEELAHREQLHRIYSFDGKRRAHESPQDHALRLLGLKSLPSPEGLKQAFKAQAKLNHPDTFQLDSFAPKLKKRLAARIHENYIAIQRAHDTLKK
jgi:hypothetical protein